MFEPIGYRNPYPYGKVLVPGLAGLARGVERYPVPGGGSRAVELVAGDEFTVVDAEGLQRVEVTFFTPDGCSDVAMFQGRGGHAATGLQATLGSGDDSAKRVLASLNRSGFMLENADAMSLLGDTRPGDCETFTTDKDGLLIICVPGTAMEPGNQDVSSPIILFIKRSNPELIAETRKPADPLADPLSDFNILPGQATAYEVKAGQYIQIMDVQGRECSDFQALSLGSVDGGSDQRGYEQSIDPTTTRSLMGQGYPTPGLFAKYWSMDQQPLVEIVQDTCGRHDAFGLACTARYYDDLGYPGHVNCTDNINISLGAYNVRPRGGWPAINFFFNTMIDDTNAIGMDDPWSRPGDYVLLRALNDLVCVSSACPCDVDPANGWNPTDIQVRVYGEKELFKQSIAFRKNVEADMESTKETGFHSSFAKHTRDFVEYNGYWLPNQMNNHGAIAEYWACREKAVVMDLSPLRKYEVTGPDAEELMQMCVTRDMKKLSVGQVVYTAMCYEHGGMIDDGTVFRLGDTNFRWIGGNDTSGEWLREQATLHNLEAWVRNSTDQLCNVAVQGPKSRDILKSIVWTAPAQTSLEELGWFRFSVARIGDFDGIPIVVSRTGYTGELGYEILCHPKHAEGVFDAVWDAGQPFGMIPLGLAALDLVRIEAGLVFAGNDFCDQTDPFEAGIGFTVPLKSKTDNFIGRDALLRRKEHPVRKMVGLDLDGGLIPATGDSVRLGKAQVGEITSTMKSPILGKVIALCRVDVTHSEVGTKLEVGQLDGQQKRIPATIVPFPHFDPTKERAKGNYA